MLLQKFILPIDCCAVATFAGSTAGPAVAIEGSMINFYSYIYGTYSLFLLIQLNQYAEKIAICISLKLKFKLKLKN